MKVYKVKVNGKLFEVELEAVSEENGTIKQENSTVPTSASTSSNGAKIIAPISGKLLEMKVKVGDRVSKGQIIAVIEAMKLENEVPSTAEGTVIKVLYNAGASVNTNDVLVVLG